MKERQRLQHELDDLEAANAAWDTATCARLERIREIRGQLAKMPVYQGFDPDMVALCAALLIEAIPANWPQARKTARAQVLVRDALNDAIEQCAAACVAHSDRANVRALASKKG